MPGDTAPREPAEDYASQSILVLRDLCRQRGLPVAGAKVDLVDRLAANESQGDQAAS